ncbi:MAG: hypothetical protein A3G49_04115 [Candidatus Sungbacteria bacterium RIFCSPLOWO2_12_FULL_41_11]|uniref:Uncharacterized protein n=1 Tax=Candidatus Sungbacteria bacterium RIFCSPLOWO2_12_FULL_41_11 TaxID=1802286 RepID=A0A1G2LT68_9BACT|nr:MAG: hypothetical protein UV01_C0010G0043 [Parcubacteria group bacterium GW2011_GWA2_42_14]OGZ99321.1 MAG: hypothetical protein A3D41_02585 [Candidatus Sungbacteria bacterium RIFCSPHIGHO2_02_FULL_41_12b]OHA14848.1 MAG: hypothetical protein A3G49_04115 [Candidatus Sungbacteria bacterium RIFCSPLOWO2_12_FULL_41_11]
MAQKHVPMVQVDLSKEIPRLMGQNNNCDARFEWQAIERILKQEGITDFDTEEILKGIADAENAGYIKKTVRCTNMRLNIIELCFSLTWRGFSKFGVEKH